MASSLPTDLAQFVEREIASGKYQSEAEVICEGLRTLRERERRLEALRKDVQAGLDQLDRGEGAPLDAESIKARGRQRLASGGETG